MEHEMLSPRSASQLPLNFRKKKKKTRKKKDQPNILQGNEKGQRKNIEYDKRISKVLNMRFRVQTRHTFQVLSAKFNKT